MKRYIFFIFLFIYNFINSQTFVVTKFEMDNNDMDGSTNWVKDLNGNKCALIKIVFKDITIDNLVFEPDGNIFIKVIKNPPSQIWVYVPAETKRFLISTEQNGSKNYFNFPSGTLYATNTYIMELELNYNYQTTIDNNEEFQIFSDLPKTEMVFVQGGTFTMGCTDEQGSDCYKNEKPAHQVTLSDYYIGKYEVTQGLWKKVVGSNPSYFKYCGDDCPVENVSWDDCQEFISKLNQLTGKRFRLPTEAEWEYAAREGREVARNVQQIKYAGSNNLGEVAWYRDNSDVNYSGGIEIEGRILGTHTVGTKKPNALGIYDMSGNVWEWCNDWYGDYSSGWVTNPKGASTGYHRVIRGDNWLSNGDGNRVSRRYIIIPVDSSIYNGGIRLVFSSY